MLYVNPLDSAYARNLNLGATDGRKKLAYRELEHVFLKQLLDEMSKTVPKDSLFGSGVEADYQRDLLNDSLAGAMADSGQFGIAKQMAQQDMLAVLNHRNIADEMGLQAIKASLMHAV